MSAADHSRAGAEKSSRDAGCTVRDRSPRHRMKLITKLSKLPLVRWVLEFRFLKFGTVGASGTVVNLGVLYFGQEYLFAAIQPPAMRLNVSLGLAIFCATV